MHKLYSPESELELAFIQSLLEAEGIEYYVHNDHFGSLKIGPKIDLFNAKTIFVRKGDSPKASEIIAGYLAEQNREEGENDQTGTAYTFKDRLRVIFETLLFWWFIPPGRRWRGKKKKEKAGNSGSSKAVS